MKTQRKPGKKCIRWKATGLELRRMVLLLGPMIKDHCSFQEMSSALYAKGIRFNGGRVPEPKLKTFVHRRLAALLVKPPLPFAGPQEDPLPRRRRSAPNRTQRGAA